MKRNPRTPWNPQDSVAVSPEEYERQVVEWLSVEGAGLTAFSAKHQVKLRGSSGEYAFDGVAEFTILQGAKVIVIIECKRHSDPVKRDDLLSLEAKLRDTGAHKAMIFSTAGFQSGALEYASTRGIATVTFLDGLFLYETRGADDPSESPLWAEIPRFSNLWLVMKEGTITDTRVGQEAPEALSAWLVQ